jgi:hypothetical protein
MSGKPSSYRGNLSDDTKTKAWLDAIEFAARSYDTDDHQVVESDLGRAEIRPSSSPGPEYSFVGATLARDGWHRLGRAVHGKARQSAGSVPVWLRIDALDGFFQFTEWPTLDWPERISRVAMALQRDLADAGAEHLAGIVLSSSTAVSLGAADPTAENQTVVSEHGTGIRRLVSAHLVRETVVIPLRDDAMPEFQRWGTACRDEPEWLSEDLSSLEFPLFDGFPAR